MTRVCHFSSVHQANDVRIYHKECLSLAEAGYDTHLVIRGPASNETKGVTVHPLSMPSASRLRRIFVCAWKTYIFAKALDARIYHFHDPELLPYGLLLKCQGKKVIYDVHEDVPRAIESKKWIPRVFRRGIGIVTECFENFAAARIDAVVAATPTIRDRFKSINAKAVDVNNYPVIEELCREPETAYEDRYPIVCYVGVIGCTRGLRQMVNAIGKTQARLALAGRFSSCTEREAAADMEGWEAVNELGYLSRREVADLMGRCIAGLVVLHPTPAYLESQPIKLFEYMAAGLPVVASNFPLWRSIVEGHRCGICVDPLDIDEIAGSIEWIRTHPGEAFEMGRRGRAAVREIFNWEPERAKLITLYQDLASNAQ